MSQITVTTGAEPQPESPEYIQQMVDKANGVSQTPPEESPQTLYAGKYKSVEELEKGYKELQKAFSSKQTSPTPSEEKPTDPLKIDDNNTAEEVLTDKGLDITEFNKEWQETGALSQASYDRLAKAGIPQSMVDAYIEGQQVLAQRLTDQVYGSVGGQEEYTKIIEWAKTGLTPQEIQTYNEITETGDVNKISLAVRGLKSAMEEARGKTPNLINASDPGQSGNSDVFQSKSQLTAAMADPRYAKDPAYREEVIQKLSRSSIF